MKRFILSLLAILTIGLCANNRGFTVQKCEASEVNNTIRVDTNDSILKNNNTYANVYLNTKDYINALSFDVYFDSSAFTIVGNYNCYDAKMYDTCIHEDHISYTYIFDSLNTSYEFRLFQFLFKANNNAKAGDYFFDVVVNEAYDASFNNVDIVGKRKYFSVIDESNLQHSVISINGYSDVGTSVGNEFTVKYSFSDFETASGSLIVHYDSALFEFVSLKQNDYFKNSLFDYNANTNGELYLSFIISSKPNSLEAFDITFRTIANTTANSKITITSTGVYDNDLLPMIFSSAVLTVYISRNPNYDYPKMITSHVLDTSNHRVTISIYLEANSHLGAGDFALAFDGYKFYYIGYEKKLNATSFTINDKQKQLDAHRVRFSILSLNDIVEEAEIVTFTFGYYESTSDIDSSFNLFGYGLTDSLTNPISLNLVSSNVFIEGTDPIVLWGNNYLFMNEPSWSGEGTGLCRDYNFYVNAKRELLRMDGTIVSNFANNVDGKYTAILERYLAWARACGDTTPFEGDGIVLSNINNTLITKDNSIVIISVIFFILMGSLALLWFMNKEKRKHD